MNKKILYRWIKVVVLVYCSVGIAIYYGQDRLIFHPVKAERNSWYHFDQPSTELNLNYDPNTNLNIVEFKATDRPADSMAKGVVLFFHGNAGNNAGYASRAVDPAAKGYELWMMDYPGFGKSTGARDEESLYKYSLLFYKLARSRWKPDQIQIEGVGVGAGIAAQLAAVRDCRRLTLEDASYSLTASWRRRGLFLYPLGSLLHYHFPIYKYLPAVTAPVTLIHSDKRLQLLLKPGDVFVP
jgi:pimeloyl-ACP methyl ester carboxylesterase